MPTYQYSCKKCETHKDVMHKMSESPTIKCDTCGGKCFKNLIANMQANPGGIIFSNPEGTSKMDSFDYRAHVNMNKARADREAAAKSSHVGEKPYGE